MKKIAALLLLAGMSGCHTLDLAPLSEASTGTFYSNQTELELAVNDLYRLAFWGNDNELFSDNEWHRGQLTNAVIGGTMNADDANVQTYWLNSYKAIARANSFLANKDRAAAVTPASVMTRLEAEMRLIRAYQYARLTTHFGDVPFLTDPVTLEESYGIVRTGQDKILDFIFSELDFAAANLPAAYAAADTKRLTKGAAWAIKARTALYLGKWAQARDAAKAIIEPERGRLRIAQQLRRTVPESGRSEQGADHQYSAR